MFYYKKLVDKNYQYHACSKAPSNQTGLIPITQEEYERVISELITLGVIRSETPLETQD